MEKIRINVPLKNQVNTFSFKIEPLNKTLFSCIHKVLIFSHIPKTAGTSLENYLAQMFLIQDVLHINAPDLNKFPEILSVKKNFPKFIAGHHPMHGLLYQLLPDEKFVHLTMLRAPVARVVSYYNYLLSKKDHAKHVAVSGLSFNEFIEQSDLVEIHNGQAKRLAGVLHSKHDMSDDELFERARYVVDNCFTLVGVTEQFDDFLKVIEKKCDFKFHPISRKNSSKKIVEVKQLSKQQIQTLEFYNQADIMLHQYVTDKFNQILAHI